jgi:hypothetical protein
MQVTRATFNAMKASSMARRLTAKSARRKSAWLLIDKYYFSLSSTEYTKSMLILIKKMAYSYEIKMMIAIFWRSKNGNYCFDLPIVPTYEVKYDEPPLKHHHSNVGLQLSSSLTELVP